MGQGQAQQALRVSIHALRVEGDAAVRSHGAALMFQSTPSAWRATQSAQPPAHSSAHSFNPRPPRGGRRTRLLQPVDLKLFQSTPSAWRATGRSAHAFVSIHASAWRATHCQQDHGTVSIHALRVEGDGARQVPFTGRRSVSIHALRVEGDRCAST